MAKILKKVENYVEFFEKIGLPELPDEKKKEYFEDFLSSVDAKVMNRVREILSEEELAAWEACKTDEELNTFYKEHGISPSEMMVEEAAVYREQLMKNVAYLKGKMEG